MRTSPAAVTRAVLALVCAALLVSGGFAAGASASTPAGRSVTVSARFGPGAGPFGTRPYMGVDTWYFFFGDINEARIVNITNTTVRSGLRAAGYRIIWLDAGWWHATRDPQENITIDPAQWPHGMTWLAAYIHSKGLYAGIYTDAGPQGCGLAGGSYGHYQQDMNTFAAWGFDAVKVDYCGGLRIPDGSAQNPQVAYTAIRRAIDANSSHRPMLLNICNPDLFGSAGMWLNTWSYAPALADSWRTGNDIMVGPGTPFEKVLRNLDWDAAHPEVAAHGRFNDPDYLIPNLGLSFGQARAQFTMWTVLAAPLMLSADPGVLSASQRALFENREAVAIDQDPAGVQGVEVGKSGGGEVWVKPMCDGSRAVAVLNRSGVAARVNVPAAVVGLPSARLMKIRDIWAQRTSLAARLTVTVPAQSASLYRVRRAR